LLVAGLKKGLPLASWRARPIQLQQAEDVADWNEVEQELRILFDHCPNLNEAHAQLREARKSKAWARNTVLFWDDARSAEELQNALGEELT
jgi:predicted oxidoreductase (fatty acid repression mutant protein)